MGKSQKCKTIFKIIVQGLNSSRPMTDKSILLKRYKITTPNPYSGIYGPTIKPGLIHLWALKKRRNNTSIIHPISEPKTNKVAIVINVSTLIIISTKLS